MVTAKFGKQRPRHERCALCRILHKSIVWLHSNVKAHKQMDLICCTRDYLHKYDWIGSLLGYPLVNSYVVSTDPMAHLGIFKKVRVFDWITSCRIALVGVSKYLDLWCAINPVAEDLVIMICHCLFLSDDVFPAINMAYDMLISCQSQTGLKRILNSMQKTNSFCLSKYHLRKVHTHFELQTIYSTWSARYSTTCPTQLRCHLCPRTTPKRTRQNLHTSPKPTPTPYKSYLIQLWWHCYRLVSWPPMQRRLLHRHNWSRKPYLCIVWPLHICITYIQTNHISPPPRITPSPSCSSRHFKSFHMALHRLIWIWIFGTPKVRICT